MRNLATSFGFSFGLQPEQQNNEEPPAKRRKSTPANDTEAINKPTVQSQQDSEPSENRATRRTATRRKQPRRLEVLSDDERSQPSLTRSSAEQDDNFLAAKQSLGKRGRPKKTPPTAQHDDVQVEPTIEVEQEQAITLKKRGRPKKAATTHEASDIGVPLAPEHIEVQPSKPANKRARPSRRLVIEDPEATSDSGVTVPLSTESAKITTPLEGHRDVVPDMRAAETLVAVKQVKPPPKKRGRPRKAQAAVLESPAEVETSVELEASVARARELPKLKKVCQGHHEPEQAASEPTRRPRRQAATAAMSKVSEGFIEEEAPIDKKRRDPGLETVSKRGRNKVTASAVSLDCSKSVRGSGSATLARIEGSGNGPSVKTVHAPGHSLDEDPQRVVPSEKAEKKPTRRIKSRSKVLPDPASKETEMLPVNIPEQRSRVKQRVPLSEMHTNMATPTPSPEKQIKGTKVARENQRISPADVDRAAKASILAGHIRRAPAAAKAPSVNNAQITKQTEPRVEDGHQDTQPTSRNPDCYPESFALGFARPTEHTTLKPDAATVKSSRRVTKKPAAAVHAKKAIEQATDVPNKRRRAIRQDEPAMEVVTSAGNIVKPPGPRKPTAENEEGRKVDWLFEKATTRRPPTANRKNTSSKRRADREEDSDAAMDLDDLLSKIAAFVPKSMRS